MNLLVADSGPFAPRGKFHLTSDQRSPALCGAKPSAIVWTQSVGDRAGFERLLPERVCERCRRAER